MNYYRSFFKSIFVVFCVFFAHVSQGQILSLETFDDAETEWQFQTSGSAEATFEIKNGRLQVDVLEPGEDKDDITISLDVGSLNGIRYFFFEGWVDASSLAAQVDMYDKDISHTYYRRSVALDDGRTFFRSYFEYADISNAQMKINLGGGTRGTIFIDNIVYTEEIDRYNDDLEVVVTLRGLHPTYQNMARAEQLLDIARRNGVKLAFGLQGRDMIDDSSAEKQAFYTFITELMSAEDVEFWNNGWNGFRSAVNTEFDRAPVKHQRESILDTNTIALNKLGLEFKTFGAPYARNDDKTCDVFSEFSAMKVMIQPQGCGAIEGWDSQLTNVLEIEESKRGVEFGLYLGQFYNYQRHYPSHMLIDADFEHWSVRDMEEFEQIIKHARYDFPSATPYGHYSALN